LVCLDHSSLLVMWTPRNLKLSTCSTTAPSMRMGTCSTCSAVVILAPPGQVSDLLPIGYLVIVGDQAYHYCVVRKLNDTVSACFSLNEAFENPYRQPVMCVKARLIPVEHLISEQRVSPYRLAWCWERCKST
jgi:hypothetical protein